MSAEKDKYGYDEITALPAAMNPWEMRLRLSARTQHGEYVLVGCQPATEPQHHQVVVLGEDKKPVAGVHVVFRGYSTAFPSVGKPAGKNSWTEMAQEADIRGHEVITDASGLARHTTGYPGGEYIFIWNMEKNGDLKLSSTIVENCRVINTPTFQLHGVRLTFQRRKVGVPADPVTPPATPIPTKYQVQGIVASRVSADVSGLIVRIVDKRVAGPDVVLVQKAITDASGAYQATFTDEGLRKAGKTRPDLQARVFKGDTFLGASEVRYNATTSETLNVQLSDDTANVLASEYDTLIAALRSHYAGKLSDLKETDDQQDITYLANKTGWDARAVAFAALADKFSQNSAPAGQPAIAPDYYYALFRAWLPADETTLYRTATVTVTTIWRQSGAQGVIKKDLASDAVLAPVIQRFEAKRADKLLADPQAGASSLKELLSIPASPLDDDAKRRQFAELHAGHAGDLREFWTAVGQTFGEQAAEQVQVDGRLGFLTMNNASLVQALHEGANGGRVADPLQLAEEGYHSAAQWEAKLAAAGANIPIPSEIPGNTPEAQRINYAAYLATAVSQSTASGTVANLISRGFLELEEPAPPPGGGMAPAAAGSTIQERVAGFLTAHKGRFEIGNRPVLQYIAQNLDAQVDPEAIKQVQRIERIRQITPHEQAMTVLLKAGIGSAYQVVQYERDAFVAAFQSKDRLGDPSVARQVYDRAVQVHNAVLNIALSYGTARTGIALVGGIRPRPAPGVVVQKAATAGASSAAVSPVVAYPTLEGLFGSVDYCACDHCRSLLSPAAYLVDLLQFLDPPENAKSEDAKSEEVKPLDILLQRRPDIEHLPLTCENTNTALPYIDVVNETLEYYVAHDGLSGYEGHDTGDAASEDLLASPQNVEAEAYRWLAQASFPMPLPFHQSLEALRRHFDKFQVPLPRAMERLRKNDDLDRGENPYGWRDILLEEIGLSRAEYVLLAESAGENGSSEEMTVRRLYGYPVLSSPTWAEIIAELSNAKAYTRRVGISYDDLVAILRTQFINPDSALIPKVARLGVTLAELKALHDSSAQGEEWLELLPQPLPDAAEYGGDIETWVKDAANYNRIMGLITLTLPVRAWEGDHDYVLDNCVRPASLTEGLTLYYVCTKAGKSGGTEQNSWPRTPGYTRSDGQVEWTCMDALSPVSFNHVVFRYADPNALAQPISAVEFVRLMRFIRLWRKLGWTIGQTDAVICAFYNEDMLPPAATDLGSLDTLDAGFARLLPRLGIAMRVMRLLNLTPKRDLPALLACWSPIGVHGPAALYRQMFLNPTLLAQDPAFVDNGYGEYLQKTEVDYSQVEPALDPAILAAAPGIGYDHNKERLSYAGILSGLTRDVFKNVPGVSDVFKQAVDGLYAGQRLAAHSEALRSAFNLTGDEYAAIVDALCYSADTELSIPTVSAIFRRGWLARQLKLSVREFLRLTDLTGLDPFALPTETTPSALTNPAVVRLIALVQALKDRSLKPAAALYLTWNHDLSGKSAPDPAQVEELARTLRGDFATIKAEFAVVEDPGADAARARMALVYGQDVADTFLALLDDTLVMDVPCGTLPQALQGKMIEVDSSIGYDDFRHRLFHAGILAGTLQVNLKALVEATEPFKAAVNALFARGEAIKGSFFTRHPELMPLYDAYVGSSEPRDKKRAALLASFRPQLAQRRKRQQALQRLSASASVDWAYAQTLLDSSGEPYPLHAVGDTTKPALDDVLAVENAGLEVRVFFSDALPAGDPTTWTADLTILAANLNYAPDGDDPLPKDPVHPGNAISGIWQGQLEAPESGYFNFIVEVDAGATVRLKLDGQEYPLTPSDTLWRNRDALELKAGTLVGIELVVEKVRDKLSVKWETPSRPRQVIPGRYLYSPTLLQPFFAAYTRFLKATTLAATLRLTANETAYLATYADFQVDGDGWLNALAVTGTPDGATATALLAPLQGALDFARLKAALAPNDERLLVVVQNPAATLPSGDSLLLTLTRWDSASRDDLLAHFGKGLADISHVATFVRVYDALALARQMGIPAGALIEAATNEPTSDVVRSFQAALRARYDATSWRDLVRPINDAMRGLQRDALVAYSLHRLRADEDTAYINTPDELFEYFLMDVQMEPCMQTSRIRHALSSVQLFVERCLMNLEPAVKPSLINAKHWEWMKRYRVWEANRKVFLFPENWLEPELRDDKSPFFKEIESELLQSDITEDAAATALRNYLMKLEEVARLEPCGIYHAKDVDHVIARTAGAHRKYFYRRRQGGAWTAWEQVKLDIEDNPVLPVVWRDRVFLFWLRILKQPLSKAEVPFKSSPGTDISTQTLTSLKVSDIKEDPPKVTVQAVLCWSEYTNGKWQPVKTSDVSQPVRIGDFTPAEFDRNRMRMQSSQEGSALLVHVGHKDNAWKSFKLYNTYSLPSFGTGSPPSKYRTIDSEEGKLVIRYSTVQSDIPQVGFPREVLSTAVPYVIEDLTVVEPVLVAGRDDAWKAPFFYQDQHHVFFVNTTYLADAPAQGNKAAPGESMQGIKLMNVPLLVVHEQLPPFRRARLMDITSPIVTDPKLSNPAPVRQLVNEDGNIKRGIGAIRGTMYGGKPIGPNGAQLSDLFLDD